MRYCVFPFWELLGLPRIVRRERKGESSPMPEGAYVFVELFFSQCLFREVRR
jgi:hypothetical protein